jgi:hypothetical protein
MFIEFVFYEKKHPSRPAGSTQDKCIPNIIATETELWYGKLLRYNGFCIISHGVIPMMSRMRFSIGLMVLALFVLQSCRETPIDPWDPGNGGDPKPITMAKYYGVEWTLRSIAQYPLTDNLPVEEEVVPSGQVFTIMFQPSFAMGRADCNQYRSEVKLWENSLSVLSYGGSKVLCDAESLDKKYASLLQSAYSYAVNEKELEIYCKGSDDNSYTLRYVRSGKDDGGNDGGNDGGGNNDVEFLPLIPMPGVANMPPSTRDIQVESVSVDKHLVVAFSYSGGCAPVHFRFYADPQDMSTPEDGITIHMMTDGQPDMCQAMVYGKKMVDLSLVRSHLPDYTKPEPVKFTLKYNGREYVTEGYIQ